jgi:hypothetical protein
MHGLVGRDPNTVANRTIVARTHVIPGLGKRRLAELTAEEIDSWLEDKTKRAVSRSRDEDRCDVPVPAIPEEALNLRASLRWLREY